MFTGKEILTYIQSKEKIEDYYAELCNCLYPSISIINQVKLWRINYLINRIASAITTDSFWDYIPGCFLYKSDFKYDDETRDITFTINSVKRKGNCYTCSNGNEREKVFFEKYKEPLKRLAALEIKRARLYKDSENLIRQKNVSPKKEERLNPSDNYYNHLRNKISEMFGNLTRQGISIQRLLGILNDLDKTKTPMDVYDEMRSANIQEMYKPPLFAIVAYYSNPGQDFYDIYKRSLFSSDYGEARFVPEELNMLLAAQQFRSHF